MNTSSGACPGSTMICEQLGDDLVLKPVTGHSGYAVVHRLGPQAISRALSETSETQVMQPLARDAHCRDQRLIVVGERVVAAYERLAPAGDFRANSSLGGTMTAIHPEPETTSLALRACHLDIASVDILHSPQHGGTIILEVNTNCGIVVGLPTLTGRDYSQRDGRPHRRSRHGQLTARRGSPHDPRSTASLGRSRMRAHQPFNHPGGT